MRIDLTIKNYRCFRDSQPASVMLRPGFIALLGANNSGKSSLLKFFYEIRGLFETARDIGNALREALRGQPRSFNTQRTITDLEEMFCKDNDRGMRVGIRLQPDAGGPPEVAHPDELAFTVFRGTNSWQVEVIKDGKPMVFKPDCEVVIREGRQLIHSGGALRADLTGYLKALDQLARTLYIGPFRNAINVGTKEDYFDIHVGQSFIKRWRDLKTGGQRKDNEAIHQLTNDIRRIFGFDSLEINTTPDDQHLHLFVDGKSYRLTEQGSGLAQFILVLANAAIRKPAYVLIDEPELNLHASLHLDFLTTLTSYASEGVMFATHSYGLARAAGDLVYSVRREPDGARRVAPLETTHQLPEFLGELGYSGYAALGFDKVLLVEGPSEVKTLQQFLRLFGAVTVAPATPAPESNH